MMVPDWLTGFDDMLVHRLHSCTLCGRRPVNHGGIWDIDGQRCVAFVFCRYHSETMAQSEQALDALLRGRYRPGGE